MTFEEFRNCLQSAYYALQSASPRQQDRAFNALFRVLDSRKHHYYPPLFYKQSLTLLRCYLDQVLPRLEYEPDDRQALANDYLDLILAVKKRSTAAQTLYFAFERLLEQLRKGEIVHVRELADNFSALAERFFGLRKFAESHSFGSFQDDLRLLQENFNFTQTVTLFQGFFEQVQKDEPKPSDERLAFYHCTSLFKAVLDAYFQEKAVLVDNFRQGHVIPLDIAVDSSRSSAQVEFWNQHVDPAMQKSADTARRIARQYLLEEHGKELPETLSVQCCFPKNDVKFTDGSASLLLGIRIVADVLGRKGKAATLISGEIGGNGEILKVGFINEKLEAARRHEGIDRVLIPEANIPELNDFSVGNGIEIVPVRTFVEAVRQALEYHVEDWGEAPQIEGFCGREQELMTLRERILDDACRFVPILGMGGVGKTSLAKKLAGQLSNRFQYVFWRDLRNAPAAKDVLGECIKFLSKQQEVDLPKTMPQRISLLFRYLKKQRCLLVLDNLETILQIDDKCSMGICFQEEYRDYGIFIQQIATTPNQSCLILTSREFPVELSGFTQNKKDRPLRLQGLKTEEAECLLTALEYTAASRIRLIESYGGHPLALRIVAAMIRDRYHGDITMFFQEKPPLFSSIENLLKEQYALLSKQERDILFWLTIEREAVPLAGLRNSIVSSFLRRELPRVIESLHQKSLIENMAAGFILQPVILEYLTTRLVHSLCQEILSGKSSLLQSHALLKARGKEYIRHSQTRFILKTVVDILEYEYDLDRQEIGERLQTLLAALLGKSPSKPGYAAGNILNFLLYLNADLQGCDFSNRPVWQAYLQGTELHNVNFTNADLRGTVFTDTFGNLLAVDYSPDGKYLAAGTLSKEIRIWDAADYQQLCNCTGHDGWVWSIAFSPDGQMIASGSHDRNVKLWDVANGKCRITLKGHSTWVKSVAFSPDGVLLASGGTDGIIIWEAQTGDSLFTLQDPAQAIYPVAFSPDGRLFAASREDYAIQLWHVERDAVLCCGNIASLRPWKTLSGHRDRLRSLRFNPDGDMLLSGSDDHTVRVWDIDTTQCLKTLSGHSDLVKSAVFSTDGKRAASAGNDCTIRIWDAQTWQCLKTLQGHNNWVWSTAFKPHTHLLASGASDQSLRIWDTSSGQCINTIEGYTNRTTSVAFNPDGQQFVTGHSDQSIHLWDLQDGCWQRRRTFQGHTNWVMSVAFSPNGQMLASGSSDKTIRIWEPGSGRCVKRIQQSHERDGHSGMVRSVTFSPDGNTLLSCGDDKTLRLWGRQENCLKIFHEPDWIHSAVFSPDGVLLASGSQDHHVRVWDIASEECLYAFQGHTQPVRMVAFSPDGHLLASGSEDRTVRLWDMYNGQWKTTLEGHRKPIRAVAFNPNGDLLASGSEDQSIRLWDVKSGRSLYILQCCDRQDAASDWIGALAFSPDGQMLICGEEAGSIRLWNVQTGECLETLHPERPYEGMNISGATGISEAQKATLKALGAVENDIA